MGIGIVVLVALLFCSFAYDHLEISLLKHGLLKAMASQSHEVRKMLQERLRSKPDVKIRNKEYRIFEKIYLTSLNGFILQNGALDSMSLRKIILQNERFLI